MAITANVWTDPDLFIQQTQRESCRLQAKDDKKEKSRKKETQVERQATDMTMAIFLKETRQKFARLQEIADKKKEVSKNKPIVYDNAFLVAPTTGCDHCDHHCGKNRLKATGHGCRCQGCAGPEGSMQDLLRTNHLAAWLHEYTLYSPGDASSIGTAQSTQNSYLLYLNYATVISTSKSSCRHPMDVETFTVALQALLARTLKLAKCYYLQGGVDGGGQFEGIVLRYGCAGDSPVQIAFIDALADQQACPF